MTLILNGTDNSATTPAVTGTDTDTGIYYPTSNQVAIATAGTQAMLVDASQNVTIISDQISSATSHVASQHAMVLRSATTNQRSIVAVAPNGSGGAADFCVSATSDLQTNYNQIRVGSDGTGFFIASEKAGTETLKSLRFGVGGTALTIDTSNNVLVGTTSNIPANAKIFAKGNGVGIAVGYGTGGAEYRHLYMNNGDGSLYFFNDTNYASLSAAGSWTNASDARLKKNIVDIKYGLADVLRMHPRSYQMNDVAGDFVGFVAQELKEVIPEVVSGDPEKQLGVDYGSLVAVAFKAIQEQQVLITSLTARIAALEGTPA